MRWLRLKLNCPYYQLVAFIHWVSVKIHEVKTILKHKHTERRRNKLSPRMLTV